MKAVLSKKNVSFAYADMSASMDALKSYLLMRDTSEAFRDIRGTKVVGIPLLVVDGEPYVLEDENQAERLIEELELGK